MLSLSDLTTLLLLAPLFLAAPVSSSSALTPEQQTEIASLPPTTQSSTFLWGLEPSQLCGVNTTVLDMVIALPESYFTNTTACGKYVIITNPVNNLTTTAHVTSGTTTTSVFLNYPTGDAIYANSTGKATHVLWRFANVSETISAMSSSNSASPSPLVAPASTATPSATEPTSTPIPITPDATPAAPAPQTTANQPAAELYAAPAASPTSTESPATDNDDITTAATATPTTSSNPSFWGSATYYTQNGNAGACGNWNSDDANIVALQTDMYAGGSNCGRQIMVTQTSSGKTLVVTVADECPTCGTSQSIDLSVGAFQSFADTSEGEFDMSWQFI